MSRRIQTPEAILSYPNLLTPSAMFENQTPKYGATFIFTKDTDISDLKTAAINVLAEKFGEEVKGGEIKYLGDSGLLPFLVADGMRLRLPWRDHPEDVAEKGYPEGSTFITARNEQQPGFVTQIPDEDGKPTVLEDESKLYAGAIVRAGVDAYAYDNVKQGASFGLWGVQWVRDGERLDGRPDPRDAFDADPNATADLSDMGVEGDEEEDDLSDLIG